MSNLLRGGFLLRNLKCKGKHSMKERTFSKTLKIFLKIRSTENFIYKYMVTINFSNLLRVLMQFEHHVSKNRREYKSMGLLNSGTWI